MLCVSCESGETDPGPSSPAWSLHKTPLPAEGDPFLFFSRPGPSRLWKLSVEDSYLLGDRDFHTFLRGPEGVSEKRGYTLLDRRVLCSVCAFLWVWFFTREGDWILKFSELPLLSGDNPLWGMAVGVGGTCPMFSCPSDGERERPCA